MGVNCCKQTVSDTTEEIQSEAKELKSPVNNDPIIKPNLMSNEDSSHNAPAKPVKSKPISNKAYTPIETNDYPANLFHILNTFRSRPDLYSNEAAKYELKHIFEEACRFNDRPYVPDWSIEKNKQLHDYLINPQNNDKTSSEKEKEILEMFEGNGSVFQSIGPINNLEANIWSLLETNSEESSKILTNSFQTIIIASVPIEGTDKLHTSYVFMLGDNSFKLL